MLTHLNLIIMKIYGDVKGALPFISPLTETEFSLFGQAFCEVNIQL